MYMKANKIQTFQEDSIGIIVPNTNNNTNNNNHRHSYKANSAPLNTHILIHCTCICLSKFQEDTKVPHVITYIDTSNE